MADDVPIEALLDALTVEEQVALLSGTDYWHTAAIERLGIPAMRVTDGPVGARGTSFANGPASVLVPCSTALAASWDSDLVEEVGRLLGRETRAKGARVLLAPTVNLHRTPIGGRNFECMSEDPFLTARTAVAYVRGLQAEGVAACIKHFVGNDTEFERLTIDSRIDERTLREIYLVPFEAAVNEAGVLAVMTSYNRVNGTYAADSVDLVEGVLRREWGFDGAVVSDWFGLHSTVEGLKAGVDLEMPGPTMHRGAKLVEAVREGLVTSGDVRRAARNVLELLRRVDAFGDGGPGPEGTGDDAVARPLVRRAATAGTVLLRNELLAGRTERALPLPTAGLRRVAVVGPNAARPQLLGGGSAQVRPVHVSFPVEALRERLGPAGVEVVHAPGCVIYKTIPPLSLERCRDAVVSFYDDPEGASSGGTPFQVIPAHTAKLMWTGDDPDAPIVESCCFSARFRPDVSGWWTFGVTSTGITQLSVDGVQLLDNADAPVGGSYFTTGRDEVTAAIELQLGREYKVEARMRRVEIGQTMGGLTVGAAGPARADLIDEAVDLAAASDAAVVTVGTDAEWESEGSDRADLSLPGRQDELVHRVAAACPRTIVVVNAGSPVAMPWLDEVAAVLVVWFPGQEMGDALTDVLLGEVEPGGRLPVTFPRRLEDTPAFEHHPGRNGVADYAERRLVGYRWYDSVGRDPLFPFGFGLGYASIEIVAVTLVDRDTVEVVLRNTGDREGIEVVQVYAHRLERAGLAPDEPDQRLAGFAKVPVPAGTTTRALVALDPRTSARWSVADHAWVDDFAPHELRIGTSSRHVACRLRRDATPDASG